MDITNPPTLLTERQWEIFADLCQFSLSDGQGFTCDPSRQWIDDLCPPQMLATADGVVSVGTIRDMPVPVTVQIWDQHPEGSQAPWDQITDASITVRTGRLVVMGPSDDPARAVTVPVAPGSYRARIHYAGMDTLSGNGLDADDHYRIALWPGPHCPITVVKPHTWDVP